MENYKKGKNVEEPLEKSKIPINNLPEKFIWMQVTAGSKMRNLLTYAMKEFKECGTIVWSGSGSAVGKVISCAEIMKRKQKLHQINKICYRKVEEHWNPILEDLDSLMIVRELPTIHILLSIEPLDTNDAGYQAPISQNSWRKAAKNKNPELQHRQVDRRQFESFGLRSDNQKRPKNYNDNRAKSFVLKKDVHNKMNKKDTIVEKESQVKPDSTSAS